MIRTLEHTGHFAVLVAGSLALAATPALGQALDSAALQASFDCFERSRLDGKVLSECSADVVAIERIIIHPDEFSSAYRAVLDGLERLGVESESHRVRIGAVGWLLTAGEWNDGAVSGDILRRVRRIYRAGPSASFRFSVVQRALRQPDTAAVLELLTEVAQDDRPGDRAAHFSAPSLAVSVLADMGPRGSAILERLHTEDSVKHPLARYQLQELAKKDFRRRPDSL